MNPAGFLSTPLDLLPGTRGVTVKKLNAMELHTFGDLIHHYPFRYEDFHLITPVAQVQPGELVTVQGIVTSIKTKYTRRRGFTIQEAVLQDETGSINLTWYNQPYIVSFFKNSPKVSIAGLAEPFLNAVVLKPQEYEIIKDTGTIHTGRLVPVYPTTRGLSSRTIREKIWNLLHKLKERGDDLEWLPKEIIRKNEMIEETEALLQIHFPENSNKALAANNRLSFDELFTIQLSSAMVRKAWRKETVGNKFVFNDKINSKIRDFIASLPFELTTAQNRVVEEIVVDLQKENPMNRFLQGDVGSGKTVIAAIGSYIAHLNGFKSLIMAPTEVLANQHYKTVSKLFEKHHDIRIGLQTGTMKSVKNNESDEDYTIMIGTHALITKKLSFDKVGLVVIDEQHRFGVSQRAELKNKGVNPHLLSMTATPIPRTVSLTLYGELDLSVIDEMPKGRLPIKTYLTPHNKRADGYEWIKKHIDKDSVQIYVICPLIEESETETMTTVRAAEKEYDLLKNKIFKDYRVALLHGKMKGKEKDEVMTDFKEHKYDILVSTSVVEVGIDVPNATIMIIEGAERFGLAQLHQLRGRVGRGDIQSYCLLYTSTEDVKNTQRLKFFCETASGMKLSEFDLKTRGPGSLYGTAQSGYQALKIANFGDMTLIKRTKTAASKFLDTYSFTEYPEVQKRVQKYQVHQIARD